MSNRIAKISLIVNYCGTAVPLPERLVSRKKNDHLMLTVRSFIFDDKQIPRRDKGFRILPISRYTHSFDGE